MQLDVKVTRRRAEADGIDSFELMLPDGGELPPFRGGAHIDVVAPNGMLRQYSLCNHPAERQRYVIGVLRDPASRGASQSIHAMLSQGDMVRISAPRNHFPLAPTGRSLLLAAGIGITPLMCMAQELFGRRAGFALHYCARSRKRAAFLEQLARSDYADRVHLHFDDGDAAQQLDLHALLATPELETHIYVCGPAGFIALVKATALEHGWRASHIHVEHFGAVQQDMPAPGSFDVRIASSGQVIRVGADTSVADALAKHGVVVPVSCMEGVCGTCITRVLDGIPEHRDCYFSDEEKARNDQFMPCCSRAASSTLVLDL
ncbi:MAG TPA: PDR/VanB family oxidoreductase [Telluria sp.]|jgi:vanillate O-demethylase ferredoxin subunit